MYIYDPVTNDFYNQSTTGPNPEPREAFCTVGTSGSNGSYEIFVFGGHNVAVDTGILSEKVFVLSLPAFAWFQASLPAAASRSVHTCNIVGTGGSQMIVVGGVDLSLTNDTVPGGTDPWPNGINVMDLLAMQWKTSFDPDDSTYQSPGVVTDWYGNNTPSLDPAVSSLFARAPASTSTSTATSNASSNPSSAVSSNKNNTNVGAIVGGVVGGCALVGIVIALMFLRLRRRRGAKSTGLGQNYVEKPELDVGKGHGFPEVGESRDGGELDGNQIHERPLDDRHPLGGSQQLYEM